ncbi:hypothetical protein GCM10009681_03410 [Luedemannella helvata]|uniref:FxsB family radical SAM/SPASM domain protein n=2 Tax=Luedemannella helvata TaxID=349315 RepID=A0ABN2JR48_9ACTN
MLETLRATIAPVTGLSLRMQSNGVLLTEPMCELLAEFGVRVGISLDGDRAANDRHRRYANGASSHRAVLRALELLRTPAFRAAYAGILCTVDVRNDPDVVYEALRDQQPPRLDLLLPHATWDDPPLRPEGAPAPYAQWLGRVFERWLADGQRIDIRLFESLISTRAGGPSATESVGLDPADLLVVETDGAWEQADSLKAAFDGAPATGLNVFDHAVDEVVLHPGIADRQRGMEGLCATCRSCPVVRQCGGGLYAHRYRTGTGFDNPSAYCADLKEFIEHMNARLSTQDDARPAPLPEGVLDEISAGYGDEEAIRHLVAAELMFTKSLFPRVYENARRAGVDTSEAWDLLNDVADRDPAAFRAVLAHPYVRAWAAEHVADDASPGGSSYGYLRAIAAAAAIRAGYAATVAVPAWDGRVYLPTLGTLAVSRAAGMVKMSIAEKGFVAYADGGVSAVPAFDTTVPGWRPTRRVETAGLSIVIEDADPYRKHKWPLEPPLDDQTGEAWRDAIIGAWDCIQREAPAYVPGLRLGLRAVVPLRADPAGKLQSSTALHAFGSIAATLAQPRALAVMMVHEFQHNKLNALLDWYRLVDNRYVEPIKVAWRDDPRPVLGVLHGVYAHLAVADVWRLRARRGGPDQAEAHAQFEKYLQDTRVASEKLAASGALTSAGAAVLAQIVKTLDHWRD